MVLLADIYVHATSIDILHPQVEIILSEGNIS